MLETPDAGSNRVANTRVVTTLLCCGWGYSFAYSLFRCMLDRSGLLAILAAALPLIAVWASLERKRWGRLVLIGMSALAHALFGMMVSALALAPRGIVPDTERHGVGLLRCALRLFGESQEVTLAVLALSTATAVWFCMPWVRKEYEFRKKRMVTIAQRAIAICVVCLWSVAMIATPAPPESRYPNTPLKTPRRLTLRY